MNSKKSLNLQEIERINYDYITRVDKIRRMGGSGIASELIAYKNHELILNIINLPENSNILSSYETAAYIANSWKKHVKELRDAKRFVVLFYHRDYPVKHFDNIYKGSLTPIIDYIIPEWENTPHYER